MNQVDTSEDKFVAKNGSGLFLDDDGNTIMLSSEPHTPKTLSSRVRSDPDGSDNDDSDDDDFWM
jgi:hypothetical protein